jgi:hypothetical protein
MHKHDMPIRQAQKPEATHYGVVDSISINQRKDDQVGRINQRNHEATQNGVQIGLNQPTRV